MSNNNLTGFILLAGAYVLGILSLYVVQHIRWV